MEYRGVYECMLAYDIQTSSRYHVSPQRKPLLKLDSAQRRGRSPDVALISKSAIVATAGEWSALYCAALTG